MKLKDTNGNIYDSLRGFCKIHGCSRSHLRENLRNNNGKYTLRNGMSVMIINDDDCNNDTSTNHSDANTDKEYQNYLSAKIQDFTYYKYDSECLHSGNKYAIALLSDIHIEEKVTRDSVMGLNEYNIDIAKYRIERYFVGLSRCLEKDKVSKLYLACLGDNISGFIHEELSQENELTPPEAIMLVQSLIISGLKYLKDNNPNVSITMLMIVGNHSRTTKKIQFSNGYKLSYEYLMYKNIKSICELSNMGIEFIIPNSEMAILETPDDKRFIFIHGFQIKSQGTGTICGIYPALQRLAMKWDRTFHQTKIFLGHFHSCISIPTATVNGSIIGYNAMALSCGFIYEEPAQMYELYDMNIGNILTRKIYCK